MGSLGGRYAVNVAEIFNLNKLRKARARHVDRDAGLVQACVKFLRARTDQLGIAKRGTSAVELCLGDVPRRLGGA